MLPAMIFELRAIPQDLADAARAARRSPQYGHPAHVETASGHGPCRCCLEPFVVGRDQRLLFTYRPEGDATSLMAPGPVFIHAEHCRAWQGAGFPEALAALPLAFEGRGTQGIVTGVSRDPRKPIEQRLAQVFALDGTEYIHVRHAEAGCYIARVDRRDARSLAA
jgi:hypothetical protein